MFKWIFKCSVFIWFLLRDLSKTIYEITIRNRDLIDFHFSDFLYGFTKGLI